MQKKMFSSYIIEKLVTFAILKSNTCIDMETQTSERAHDVTGEM